LGSYNQIHVGWYQDSMREGNWMALNPDDMSVIESGFYKDG